jgi:hypothetical protein
MREREPQDEPKPRPQDEQGAGQEARPERGPERTHESGYGGRGGEPRTSSDEREPKEPEGLQE